jgi:hypothetical protein
MGGATSSASSSPIAGAGFGAAGGAASGSLFGPWGAAVGAVIGAGAGAYGSYVQGKGQKAAADYKAASLERSAQYGKLAAAQTGGQLTERLNETLGNIDAARAAAHDDPTSPTGAAVRDTEEYIGTRQRGTAILNLQAQTDQEIADADYLRRTGKFALGMGELGAVTSLAGTVGKTNFSNFGTS